MPSDIFDQIPLFQGLSPAQLDLLRPLFVSSDCHPGTVLFDQGGAAIFLYLVISGEVAIRFKPEDGKDIIIARVRDGGMVGWSAVIGRQHYTSAAICTQHTQMLRVRGSDLQTLREQHPETGLLIVDRLANVVAERLQGSHPQVVALLEIGLRNGVHQEAK